VAGHWVLWPIWGRGRAVRRESAFLLRRGLPHWTAGRTALVADLLAELAAGVTWTRRLREKLASKAACTPAVKPATLSADQQQAL